MIDTGVPIGISRVSLPGAVLSLVLDIVVLRGARR